MGDNKKVAWNASEGLIMEISNRRSMANSFFINGNIKKAFNALISIKQSVIQSFRDTERDGLSVIENNFTKISPALNPLMSSSFNSDYKKIYSKAYNLAARLYSRYNNKLMDLLESRGYLIGEQTDSSKMKF